MTDDSPEEETRCKGLPGGLENGRRTKPLPLRELAEFRASMPRLKRSSAEVLRGLRDEDR